MRVALRAKNMTIVMMVECNGCTDVKVIQDDSDVIVEDKGWKIIPDDYDMHLCPDCWRERQIELSENSLASS